MDRASKLPISATNALSKTDRPFPDDYLTAVPEEAVWLANFVSARTRRTYQAAVRSFIAFHGLEGSQELRAIGQSHLIAWREHLIQSGASPRTVQNRLAAVSSLFQHLCERQVAPRNPVAGVKRPRVNTDRVEATALTPEQVRRLLQTPAPDTLKGMRDRAILHVLFYTGCRVSEVTHLKVKDFFEDAGYWVLDFLVKGGQRNRLAIHHELQLALRAYLAVASHGYERESPLFLTVMRDQRRKPLTSRQVSKLFHRYAFEADLPLGVTPHSARATFITEALDRKCPIEAVQASVGHRHIATTKMYDKRKLHYRESASFAVRY
ncbi:MAG: tyrosine-type recombinase/integrase [Candidatus Competibacteraceae bacterium]|nr:tyrosine-type recombinase/integrase [Candidatus Competibacteraceae bacterium]MBK8895897.1 tyrosine-type recombinase/integrase [Candidatus Competibacteraceae bacterium]